MEKLTAFFGIFVFLLIAWLFSVNKKSLNYKTIFWGMILQILFAILVFGIPAINLSGPLSPVFAWINHIVIALTTYASKGGEMVFGSLIDIKKNGFIFFVQIVPVILLFSALTSIAYYLKIFQKVVGVLAILMKKLMFISGAESLSVASNVFIGPSESILVVRPYVGSMTRSELMALMVGGLATIDASVLPAYVELLRDRIPDITSHLITASVMSAPAAFVIAKIMIPETQIPQTLGHQVGQLKIPEQSSSLLEAIAHGTRNGVKLCLNIMAMLIVFIALVALINGLLGVLGQSVGFATTNGDPLTLEFLLGMVFAPLAWFMGIPWSEATSVGSLLGQKMVLNEFIAYLSLADMQSQLSDRTIIIASYALCGFANFGSIGLIVGAMSIISPNRQSDFASLGFKSMVGGTLATIITGAIVSILL